MGKNPHRVVVDTNVLISAIIFGGKPRQILNLIQDGAIVGITSPILIAELTEILSKKFSFPHEKIILVEELIKETFEVIYPHVHIEVLEDKDDDRVLEAAIEAKAQYIVTGDSDLLDLNQYEKTEIFTPAHFLLKIGK